MNLAQENNDRSGRPVMNTVHAGRKWWAMEDSNLRLTDVSRVF